MGVYETKAATGTVLCGVSLAGGEWSLPVDRISNWSGNCYGHRASCADMCCMGLTTQDTDGV